ncbi:RHS repeat-associated core domain-containing protein [Archangium sp.]|uniref:RHS repeat-associated core domain-containing protein n=1 Tax=Archangium sp. TaxID=1872627 RepID=UPI00286D2785|nr:RHS repeat-associated core domain-containing protein [Archangium sp.]
MGAFNAAIADKNTTVMPDSNGRFSLCAISDTWKCRTDADCVQNGRQGTCVQNSDLMMGVVGNSMEPLGAITQCKYPRESSGPGGGQDFCDGLDNDGDGAVDEDCADGGGGDGGVSDGGDGNTSCGQEICQDNKDNDCDNEVDEDCTPSEPDGGPSPSCVGPKCKCTATNALDPVNMASGTSYERVEDVRFSDGLTSLRFERTFSSRANEWIFDAPLVGVPKPFGASPNNPESIEWWHNWLSLVVEHQYYWSVRDGDGQMMRFTPCTGVPCEAFPTEGNISRTERLKRTATGYELLNQDGSRHIFEARFVAKVGGRNRYFLSRVLSKTGLTLANLSYTLPTGCNPGAAGSSEGVPYLSSVQTQAGGTLKLTYRALPRANGTVECVIGKVSMGVPDEWGGSIIDAVTYSYDGDGVSELPGRIGKAQYRKRMERYLYTGEEFQVSQLGVQLVRHVYGVDGRVASAVGGGYGASIAWEPTSGSCQAGSNCCGQAPQVRQVTDAYAGRGDGNASSAATLMSTYETLSNYGQYLEPRLYQKTDACNPSAACSPGSERSEWSCSSPGNPGRELARKDKRDNWEVYEYSLSAEVIPRLERTGLKRGASDMTGAGALEEKHFGYTYSNGRQLPQSHEEASVLQPGQRKRTSYVYEAGTDRTKAVIESGWTQVRDGTGNWVLERRLVGTFFFTSSGGTSDPLERVLEVHGPCAISSESDTDCPASADYPLTKYEYYPNWLNNHSLRNRLKAVRVYGSRLSGVELVTRYDSYDSWGNATSIVDPVGSVSNLTYEEDRLLKRSQNYKSSVYQYLDGRRLSAILHPSGNYEVFCYREGTLSGLCRGGTLTDKLQWTARARYSDGTDWTERVVYAYWPDGTLKEERYVTWTGSAAQTRRVLKYAADAHKRPTWQKWGEGTGSFGSAKSFDGADNLTGVGLPFNDPPAWCGGVKSGMSPLENGTPLSQLCSSMAYDRANRLVQVDEYPSDGVSQRTLFQYDVQGNVSGVKTGCLATDTFATCSQPATTYTYDDFGQVVKVQLPHAEGPVRYAYDVRGNVVVKETEAMRREGEYLSYTFDMLSRLVSARRIHSAGQETLYRYGYDGQESYPAGCSPFLDPYVRTYTEGRVRYRDDSLGRTWYTYDVEGRLIGEVRMRAGETTCGTTAMNPHTFYTYTPNGHLASVTYPNGRKVTYVYGTAGNTDRVMAVDVTLYDGTTWTTQRLLSTVTWEPYGGLRGYTLNHPTSGTTSTVEYALGDDGSVAPVGCSATFPSAASSDLTGRLRSLRVSQGTVAMGAGSGDIYRRTYTWKADQVMRTDTCLLGATVLNTETYGYDRTLRLTGASRPAGNFAAVGGAFDARAYGYDGRGNRTSMSSDGSAYSLSYAAAPQGDRLTGWNSSATGSLLGYSLAYDADGRVTRKEGARKLDGQPAYVMGFAYGQSVGVATETVFRAVEVNGVFYNYYYDAQGRRRAKRYPTGTSDEYFHDVRNQLLVDRGSSSITTPVSHYTQDDYVWLDGRPVAMVRGKLNDTWTRLPDASTDCSRNGDAAACGVYFPVTDHIGKPVLMLDGSGRVVGNADYDPFGQVNRVALSGETQHPLDNSTPSTVSLAAMAQPTDATVRVKMRALFHLLDMTAGQVELVDGEDGGALLTSVSGTEQARFWSDWVQPSTGNVSVKVVWPGSQYGLVSAGVVLEGYEYQRYQAGAQPFWTPLRFPGQYHDTETGLFENWNRFYDPSTGRYLQPEPLLAATSVALPVYAYSLNNPLGFVDPTGFVPGEIFRGGSLSDLRDRAAIDALLFIHPSSVFHYQEYGGMICQRSDRGVFATEPVCEDKKKKKNEMSVRPQKAPCPEGTKPIGTYHTHPMSDGSDMRNKPFPPFSKDDIDWAREYDLPDYLSRANGTEVWRWYPHPIAMRKQLLP